MVCFKTNFLSQDNKVLSYVPLRAFTHYILAMPLCRVQAGAHSGGDGDGNGEHGRGASGPDHHRGGGRGGHAALEQWPEPEGHPRTGHGCR